MTEIISIASKTKQETKGNKTKKRALRTASVLALSGIALLSYNKIHENDLAANKLRHETATRLERIVKPELTKLGSFVLKVNALYGKIELGNEYCTTTNHPKNIVEVRCDYDSNYSKYNYSDSIDAYFVKKGGKINANNTIYAEFNQFDQFSGSKDSIDVTDYVFSLKAGIPYSNGWNDKTNEGVFAAYSADAGKMHSIFLKTNDSNSADNGQPADPIKTANEIVSNFSESKPLLKTNTF